MGGTIHVCIFLDLKTLHRFKLRYPIPILSNFIDPCFKRDTCHSQHVTRGKVMTQLLIGHCLWVPFSDWPIELTPSESKSQSQISIIATWWGHAGRAARKDALCWWFVFHLMAKMWGLGFKTWQMGWWSRWEDMKIFDGKEDAQLHTIHYLHDLKVCNECNLRVRVRNL